MDCSGKYSFSELFLHNLRRNILTFNNLRYRFLKGFFIITINKYKFHNVLRQEGEVIQLMPGI